MAVIVQNSEIVLSGMVGGSASGDSWWDPPGFSSGDVIAALAEVGRETPIVIRLNSGGGIATEGAAIHAALSQHKGAVQIVVEGVAASAASVIAMAADTLTMMPGSVLMIHDPAGMTYGDAAAHEQTIKALNALGDAYAGIYAERTGKPAGEMRELMKAETWMTVEQAIASGFADAPAAGNDNAEEVEPSAFAYGVYARAPERLVAMANARGWKPRAHFAAAAAPTGPGGTTMAKHNGGAGPARAETAPSNTVAPSISGEARVGGTLQASPGDWIGADSFAFEWWHETGATPVGGEASYTPTDADAGHRMRVRVIGSNAFGATTAESSLTDPVAVADAPAEPAPAEPAPDMAAIAATLAAAHFTADAITSFIKGGGTLDRAKARAEEIVAIKDDIARAKRANPAVSLTIEDAVARNLTQAQAMAIMWPEITAQAAISPQAPPPAPAAVKPENVMLDAAERVNAQARRWRNAGR